MLTKRILAFLLCLVMLLPLVSCAAPTLIAQDRLNETVEEETKPDGKKENPEGKLPPLNQTTTKEEGGLGGGGMMTQSPYEQKVTKILILGNSHTNDVFFQLGRVFNAQGFDGQPYMLGFLYYSGCRLTQHVGFLNNNKAVYDYYKTTGTSYSKQEECTMKKALEDEAWDYIFLHPGGAGDMLDDDLQLEFRRRIEEYVHEHVKTEHQIAWHFSWPSPVDPTFYSKDYWRQPPATYKQNYIDNYGFDPIRQHTMNTEAIKKNILGDPTYVKTICTGSGIVYARQVLKVPELELYRDYTHLNDFGRVLAAYCFYAQFTGKPIEEVLLEKVPAGSRQSHYSSLGDLVLTDEQKRIIKESANYSLEHPWDVAGQ